MASPLEEAINGVEDMLYMQSQANSDGNLTLTVNFKLGWTPTRRSSWCRTVSQALPRLPPDDAAPGGDHPIKSSPTLTLVNCT